MLGRGAWGSTLRRLWEADGHAVRAWSRRDGGDPLTLLEDAEVVVSAVSMVAVPSLAARLAAEWPSDLPLLSCSKGIDSDDLVTASQLWKAAIPGITTAVLSGPNLAAELERGLPAASVIASEDAGVAQRLQLALRVVNLRLYTNADPIGTEVAGALKNVMAVAAGTSDGLGLGANAKASLLCRGLAEMGQVLEGLGGRLDTLYGLAGLGDLLATANSPLSRNHRFGTLLAEGCGETEALERVGATVEGPATARAALRLAERHGWHLPICEQVVGLLGGAVDARAAVEALMGRDPRPESES